MLTSAPVLYLTSSGRSGSTLIERMLGTLPGYVNVGELISVFQWGVLRNDRCGCGEPFRECTYWQQVGEHAFGGWEVAQGRDITETRQRAVRQQRLASILSGRLISSADGARVGRYVDAFQRLYASVAHIAGASVVVDGSKLPAHGLVLSRFGETELRPVHLIRDPRAVAYSRAKADVRRPDRSDKDAVMDSYSPARSAVFWSRDQVAAMLLCRSTRSTLLRYEDFAVQPMESLIIALAAVGLDPPNLDEPDAAQMSLGPSHALGGNPNRFSTGPIAIRPDREWRRAMPRSQQALVWTVTAPARAIVELGHRRGGRRVLPHAGLASPD